MKNSIFLLFSQYRYFWQLRAITNRILFKIESRIFKFTHGIREEKSNYSSLRHLFQITQFQILSAIIFALLLLGVDPYLHNFYEYFNLSIPDDSDYVTLLATISGIGGVFIGLYYAGISTVGSAIYARVPNNIRDLLAQERFGNVYMLFLSFLTFLGLVFISLRVIGFDRIYLAIPVMTVASGVGIISFVKLGQRAFYLFDPTALSSHLFEQLQHSLRTVKAGGYRWSDENFQYHAYKQSSLSLDALDTLSDITKSETHLSGKPFITLCENLILFLISYENSKNYIPSDSQWYEQKYEHRDWYRTEDSSVSLAHQSGTTLRPNVTNNKEWIEERVIPIIKNCLLKNLEKERYNEVLELAGYIDAYLKCLATAGRTKRALNILKDLSDTLLEVISPKSENELVSNEVLEKLAVIERFASMPITIAIGCREYIEKLDAEIVAKKLSNINWDKDADIYKHGFPTYCLPRLEWFKPKLLFEVTVEGNEITPKWYQIELLLQVEADIFSENTDSLISIASDLYSSWINTIQNAKHPWLVGAVISREWEFWHKVDHQTKLWETKWNNLNNERNIEGIHWASFDIDKLNEASKKRQAELFKLMSTQNLMLAFLKKPEGFPDYAGQFLHTAGEVSFEALLTNDTNLLTNVFESYLYGCIMCFQNLRPKSTSTDWRAQNEIKIAAAVLVDVIALSGYARLMSDYHANNQLWEIVVAAWDKYFESKDEASLLPLFLGAIAISDGILELPHRSVLRTSWQMKVNNRLSDIPSHEEFSEGTFSSDTIIDHDSALIRVFTQGRYGSFHDGIDIFIAFYLRHKDGAEDHNFGQKGRDLQDSIDREEMRSQE